MRVKRHRNTTKRLRRRQRKGAANRFTLLYKSKAEVIMDEEKYFCFNGDNISGSARLHTNDKAKNSDDISFNEKENTIAESHIFTYLSQLL